MSKGADDEDVYGLMEKERDVDDSFAPPDSDPEENEFEVCVSLLSVYL